ncbi:MacB-like core domain-containing protein [Paenibacillus algorifonticola]|uniref:MacB-like core domain-containing protein n=1 Tax=Paenibacillus algorifonticola TaxID=684063 RepID=A0A1I2F7U5_9BACL|nr:ABC transporter permease [Paenibacillus algorifonticola]SFF00877.1 MacB-like core domain-containing protein [Paenibacillus algorifonticola]
MRAADLVKMSWRQIVRRRVVTFLCMIGLSIGCASIIMAVSIGQSAQRQSEEQMNAEFKMDEITVLPNSSGAGGTMEIGRGDITKEKLDVIRNLSHVTAALPMLKLNYMDMSILDSRNVSTEVIGTDLGSLASFGFEFAEGGASTALGAAIVSYGATFGLADPIIRNEIFEALKNDPNNEQNYLKLSQFDQKQTDLYQQQIHFSESNLPDKAAAAKISTPLRVSGVLEVKSGSNAEYSLYEKTVYVSLDTARMLQEQFVKEGESSPPLKFESVLIKVEDKKYVAQVEAQIQQLFLTTQSNLFQEVMIQEKFALYKKAALSIGLFIMFLASLSILVAMTMSTHQRRRQIGVMKILGANLWQIRQMFVTEAALLGLLGGAVGLVISYIVVGGLNKVIVSGAIANVSFNVNIPVFALVVGIVFTVLTGVLSGIYPAVSASRTNALEVIKNG